MRWSVPGSLFALVAWLASPGGVSAADTPAPAPKPAPAVAAAPLPAPAPCPCPEECPNPAVFAPPGPPPIHPPVYFRQRSVYDGGGGGHPVWGTTPFPCPGCYPGLPYGPWGPPMGGPPPLAPR